MKRQTRPPLGTTMFCVQEHLYYIPGRAGPAKEYVIFEGKVAGYYGGPGWVDVQLRGYGATGTETIHLRLKDIGTKIFFTARGGRYAGPDDDRGLRKTVGMDGALG